MRDQLIEQELWDTFARCVPDEQQRHTIALRVVSRESRNDPRTANALEIVAATPAGQLDAAFERAVARGSFAVTDEVPADKPQPLRERVRDELHAAVNRLDELLGLVASVFESPLTLIPAAVGPVRPDQRTDTHKGDEEDRDIDDDDLERFRFTIPTDITAHGLGASGSAELHGGTLSIRVRRTTGAEPPIIVAVAVADGKASDAAVMRAGATALTASLTWDYDTTPRDILIAVPTQT